MKSGRSSLSSNGSEQVKSQLNLPSFPSIAKPKRNLPEKVQSPLREKNQFLRLSGLCDTVSSNGLFAEITT
jgi:hypothetical protein